MESKIKCPNCGESIDVDAIYAHKTEEKYKTQLNEERKKLKAATDAKELQLREKEREFEAKKKRENELFKERIEKEKKILQVELKSAVVKDFQQQMNAQRQELDEKTKIISNLKGKELEMEKLKREMQTKEKDLEIEFEKRIVKERLEYEEQIIKREQERARLRMDEQQMKMREKDKMLEDMQKQMEEMKRKMDQKSTQLQGEVQELAIEEYLRDNFPFDTIEEIKKGSRGADCLQIVNDGYQRECGTIYYESKRTKHFSPAWIEKFKGDLRDKKADIGVLVTQSMPSELEIMGEMEGIWICTFEEFKGLAFALRSTIIKVAQERSAQSNKGGKMSMLYDFLTGNEFKMQVEGIVEGFKTMKDDLDKEKRAMEKLWKQREKQLEKVILNTTHMYGSIKGIAGKAVKSVDYLELPGEEDDN